MQIVESVESTPDWEAREERRCSERRALGGHGLDMEDLASMFERQCRKACNLRSAAEELEETGSNGRARRYRKRGSPEAKPAEAEVVERVKTLRSAMEKPMGGPAEAPYAPPRVDPGALPFVLMFSESTMLGEHTAPAASMREGHATTDLRSLTVQMSHAAQDPPTTTTAHAVYAEEEIQSQTTQGRTMGSADRHGRGHPGGNLWVKDPNTGILTAGGASPSRIPNPMGSGPTGPYSMEERDVRGV